MPWPLVLILLLFALAPAIAEVWKEWIQIRHWDDPDWWRRKSEK